MNAFANVCFLEPLCTALEVTRGLLTCTQAATSCLNCPWRASRPSPRSQCLMRTLQPRRRRLLRDPLSLWPASRGRTLLRARARRPQPARARAVSTLQRRRGGAEPSTPRSRDRQPCLGAAAGRLQNRVARHVRGGAKGRPVGSRSGSGLEEILAGAQGGRSWRPWLQTSSQLDHGKVQFIALSSSDVICGHLLCCPAAA